MPLPFCRLAGSLLLLWSLATWISAAENPATPGAPTGGTSAAQPKAKPNAAKRTRQKIVQAVLLDHFCIGVEAPKEWHAEVRQQNGATFDFTVGYLSGGVGHDTPWFFKYGNGVENRILDV